ncbi:C-type lectin domain family 4 member E isoform 2-T2 [Symphorus nematophorus]
MYIKFCRSYGEDKKDLSAKSKLSVELEEEKAGNQAWGNVRLYRAACVFLTLICLVLLLVVILLGVKLQTGSVCPEGKPSKERSEGSPPIASSCDYRRCECQQCADGWLTLGQSCFFMSTYRLSWDESQRNCSARGGSLAIISSLGVQRFLTKEGKMNYWIGLRQNRSAWTWVNNTALQQGYWADIALEGDCGILRGKNPPEKNWVAASCQAYTYFICQLKM